MTLRYTNTAEDFVQFHLLRNTRTPATKGTVRALRLCGAGLLLLLALLLSGFRVNLVFALLLVLALLWVWFFPWYFRRALARGLRRQAGAGLFDDLVGKCTLTLSPEGLCLDRGVNRFEYPWSAVESAAEQSGRLHIELGDAAAIVVPLAEVDDKDALVNYVMDSVENAPPQPGGEARA